VEIDQNHCKEWGRSSARTIWESAYFTNGSNIQNKKLKLWLKPYEILATGPSCGLIECLTDAMSLDALKKKLPTGIISLAEYFRFNYGNEKTDCFKRAQRNFSESLAAYSLVCYVLQIKDRHNGNIMIDKDGHIIHIDFGFMLSNSPGKGIKLEKAPFKLTYEFVEVLGGVESKRFRKFRELMIEGFQALQEQAEKILVLVEMVLQAQRDLPCFLEGDKTVADIKERLFPKRTRAGRYKMMTKNECGNFVDRLIQDSIGNWRTIMYDRIQYCCQDIWQ